MLERSTLAEKNSLKTGILSRYSVQNQPAPDTGPLLQAAANYLVSVGQNVDSETLADIEARLAALPAPEQEALRKRFELYALFDGQSGRDLREAAQQASTPLATQLRREQENVRSALRAITADVDTTEAFVLPPRDAHLDDRLLHDPELLYQQTLHDGDPFDEAKKALDKNGAAKWIYLVDPTFRQPGGIRKMVEKLGFVPQQMYRTKLFRESVGFSDLARCHDELREAANGNHARAQLLTHLFTSEIATQAEGRVTVDINGLWVNLQRTKNKRTQRLDAHLPFPYASDAVLDAMLKQGWITNYDVTEAQLRRAEANNDVLAVRELEERQARDFIDAADLTNPARFKHSRGSAEAAEDAAFFREQHGAKLFEAMVDRQHWIRATNERLRSPSFPRWPIGMVRHFLTAGSEGSRQLERNKTREQVFTERTASMLRDAEAIQSLIANEDTSKRVRDAGYDSYKSTESTHSSYERRRKIINDSRNYDVPRIVGALMEALERNELTDCRLLRGDATEGKDRHSFIEIITKNGKIHRVVLDPEKQLTLRQRRMFESLPVLSAQEFEVFETLALTYFHYKGTVRGINDMLHEPRVQDWLPWESQRKYLEEYLSDIQAFMFMEAPESYPLMQEMHRRFLANYWHAGGDHLHTLAHEAVERFGKKLFASDPLEAVRLNQASVRRRTVTFDSSFAENLPMSMRSKSWTWDPKLCDALIEKERTIAVVDAGDREIPYAMEARAIKALRLLPDRPLVTVFGGCRDCPEGEGASAVDRMCDALMTSADTMKANMVIPGTQSGIGVKLGERYVSYEQAHRDEAPKNRARLFAVSPGGETYFPSNDHLAPESENEAEIYAIGPVDSIVTPFQAGWNWTGERKRNAPYFRHVEYAEAIYNRISAGQPRVAVIGNGGLFTLVEAVAALRNESDIVLVRDTGRFADLAISMFENKELLEKALFNHSTDDERSDSQRRKEWETAVLELIQTKVPDHSRTALLKAFGESIPATDPEQMLYRDMLFDYSILSAKAKIDVSSVENLQTVVVGRINDLSQKKNAPQL